MVLKPFFLHGFKTLFFHRKTEGPLKALRPRRRFCSSEEMQEFKDKWKIKTVPQLEHAGKLVGGFTEVMDILRNKFDYIAMRAAPKTMIKALRIINSK